MDYDIDDIFNPDESCFYIKQQDDMSCLIDGKRNGPKKDSSKMSILFACNATGYKLPPVFIGRSSNPRCFNNVNLREEEIFYRSNKAAWMSVETFNE